VLFSNFSQFFYYLGSLFDGHIHCYGAHGVIDCTLDWDDIRDSLATFPVPIIMENFFRLSSGGSNLASIYFIVTIDNLRNSALLA
jgi:hypothetical protein